MFKEISSEWNKTIISLSIVLSLLLSIYVLSDPVGSSKLLFKTYDSLATFFEPTYMYGSFCVLVFLICIAISKYGEIEISLENKETYSIFSWGSMLFAAGIGAAGLLAYKNPFIRNSLIGGSSIKMASPFLGSTLGERIGFK